ncbi:MAG: PD-(D/E)XK nuclease family protein, partial [Bacteroidaceae bacterium]|nr:PD-(D/E)XK nuclease family protein [Bacteroidaceae bacterium]
VIRIVDYKTGSRKNEPKEISELFTPGKNRNSQVLQIFYYAYTLCCKAEFADKKIAPVLLHTRHSSGADESSVYMNMNNESVTDFSNSHSESFGKELEALFSEIVNPDIPFSQCEEADTCKYCPFKSTICNR